MEKKKAFDTIGEAVAKNTSGISKIFLDIVGGEEYIVVEFKGGGKSVRIATGNSLNANIREMAKLLDGGYYKELDAYERLKGTKVKVKKRVTAAQVAIDFNEFEPWGNAKGTWRVLKDYGKLEAFEDLIEDTYGDIIDETKLNDILAHEEEMVFEAVGLYYDSDSGDVSDEPFNEVE